jgi:PKD repeat protein
MKKRKFITCVLIAVIVIPATALVSCKKNGSNSENAMPTAVIDVDTTRGDTTTLFHFDASKSTDREDTQTTLMVAWDFGDSAPGYSPYTSTKTINHSYAAIGLYNVKLVVKDSQGLADTTVQLINIVNNLSNRPPDKPVYTAPDNYSTFQPDSVKLIWLCSDPENDPLKFDVYIGYDPGILYLKTANLSDKEYTVTSMNKATNYFWRIVAHDPNGNYVQGDVWKFTTAP